MSKHQCIDIERSTKHLYSKDFKSLLFHTYKKMETPHPLPPPSAITAVLKQTYHPREKTKEEEIIRSIKWNRKAAWIYWDCGRGQR
jgi:hypothetical protein